MNAVPLFVAFFVFANHYARDTIAGLAKQLIDLNIVSPNEYSTLNSLFFLPNIITSLIISALVSKIGIGKCIITAIVIAAVGNFLFYYGITIQNVNILYIGLSLTPSIIHSLIQFYNHLREVHAWINV